MLEDRQIEFRYRDYRKEPLEKAEIKKALELLGLEPRDVLRRRDRAFRELGLSGEEDSRTLITLMAQNPTLLERPIGLAGTRAVIGRPPDRLLELIEAD